MIELIGQIVWENKVTMQFFDGFDMNHLKNGSSEIKYIVAIDSPEHVFPAFYVGSWLEEELYLEGWNGGILCWPSVLVIRMSYFHLETGHVEGLLNSLISDLLKKKECAYKMCRQQGWKGCLLL